MKVETEQLENSQVRLSVELEQAKLEQALQATAKRLSGRLNIPGFRRGKAPYPVVLRYVGREALVEEAMESLANQVLDEALKETGLQPIAPADLEDMQVEPLKLTYVISVQPNIDLGAYQELRLPEPEVTVDEQTVAKAIQALREQHAVVEPTDRPAQREDLVTLSVTGLVEGEDKPVVQIQDAEIILDEERISLGVEFVDEVVGMRAGEEKSFTVAYPPKPQGEPEEEPEEEIEGQENADELIEDVAPELLGKTVHYHVHIQGVKARYVPPLDDSLAKELGDFETAVEVHSRVRSDLQAETERRAKNEYADQVLEALVNGATFSYPPLLVERELDARMQQLDRQIRREQHMSAEDYLKTQGLTLEQVRESQREAAERDLRRRLALSEFARRENITVNSAEVDQYVDQLSQLTGEQAERVLREFSTPEARRGIEAELLTQKTIERLVEIAQGGSKPRPQILTPWSEREQPTGERPLILRP